MSELYPRDNELWLPAEQAAYVETIMYRTTTDADFGRDIQAAVESMGVDGLQALVIRMQRFDAPAITLDRQGYEQTTPHHILHLFLQGLPDYVDKARAAGLGSAQAQGLVAAMLEADSPGSFPHEPLARLTSGLDWQARNNRELGDDDYRALEALIQDTSHPVSETTRTLEAFWWLSRMGMTTGECTSFIQEECFNDPVLMIQVLPVISALAAMPIDKTIFRDICHRLIGREQSRHIYETNADFGILRECIVTVGPDLDMAPAELLELIHRELSAGSSMHEVAERFLEPRSITAGAGTPATVPDPRQRIERHFLPKPGELEWSPLPYRTERPLMAGLADLGRIARFDVRLGEPATEGLWVHDTDASPPMWYSLGGDTVPTGRGVTHSYRQFALEALSRNPVIAHCHPQAYEGLLLPAGNEYSPVARRYVARFDAALPSRRDYAMIAELMRTDQPPRSIRSIIAFGGGLVEYTFPDDPSELDFMAEDALELRRQFLAGIHWDRVLYMRRFGGLLRGNLRDHNVIARELVERFSKRLPRGFDLRLLDVQHTE